MLLIAVLLSMDTFEGVFLSFNHVRFYLILVTRCHTQCHTGVCGAARGAHGAKQAVHAVRKRKHPHCQAGGKEFLSLVTEVESIVYACYVDAKFLFACLLHLVFFLNNPRVPFFCISGCLFPQGRSSRGNTFFPSRTSLWGPLWA